MENKLKAIEVKFDGMTLEETQEYNREQEFEDLKNTISASDFKN